MTAAPSDNAVFISDLHLFSPRSVADEDSRWIARQYHTCQTVVLGGDIFDYRWSRHGATGATTVAAREWLERLIEDVDGRVIYLPGNHDAHPELLSTLDELQKRSDRFTWEYHSVRFGNTLCLHGDICDAGGLSGLERYRSRYHQEKRKSNVANRTYDVAVALRVHQAIPAMRHHLGRYSQRLAAHIRVLPQAAGVDRVIFGHSHHFLDDCRVGGLHLFNPGACLRHLTYQPVMFRIDD